MPRAARKSVANIDTGKLRIGDDWNAINIIALSQSDPLKALAEFVENSIDAGARNITITRGRKNKSPFIQVVDDGEGVPKNADGIPDFKYVATHICDSVKKRLKEEGQAGIQGEFGIGLLSFWTLGEELTMACPSADGKTYQMTMRRGDTDYRVVKRRSMFPHGGTELTVSPLLPGLRQFSGEKIQWYLASELRDRIRKHDVAITVNDHTARKSFKVEPREFDGRLIHSIPPVLTSEGEIYLELYLGEASPDRKVGLYRNGTRVLEDISTFEGLKQSVWSRGYLEGIVDVPFINLTPGSRLGVIQDQYFAKTWFALRPIEDHLESLIDDLEKAEAERASQRILKSIQKAFREALLALPPEEYDWFDIGGSDTRRGRQATIEQEGEEAADAISMGDTGGESDQQKDFFEFAGPLYSVMISPSSSVISVGKHRTFRAVTRDKSGRRVDHDLHYEWQVLEGHLSIDGGANEFVDVTAGPEPGLARIKLIVTQGDIECEAEAIVTITDQLQPAGKNNDTGHAGLPGYTYQHAAGELWRSRYDEAQHVIVINNGHRDFIYASKTRALKLRYIARLFAKEMVLKNFQGANSERLLERMIELSLYTEENLR